MHHNYLKLLETKPATGGKLPKDVPTRGVYLFSENGVDLYVGRSNNIRNRYAAHTLPSSKQNSAAFAMLVTREKINKKASYKKGPDSIKSLMIDSQFCEVFRRQKERIRDMDFRWVEETEPRRQMLLEVYCAIVLETRYNDFDNH